MPFPARDASRLRRVFVGYVLGFVAFVIGLGALEHAGLPRATIGYAFLGATILLYATIGIVSRTNDASEYYVAGRRVPALFNGMAIGADWMSAASFLGLTGGLYLQGHSALAFVTGWTGGYVLVGVLLAPYLRRFGRYTIPDFIGARYGGHAPRVAAILVVVVVSFTYVVAQIYAVGLITTRLTGVDFTVGIFLGLAGILVCSFLGGMKAVTWTQVAQYVVLIFAYLAPAFWLSAQQTGSAIAPFAYGRQLEQVTAIEAQLARDPREQEVRDLIQARAQAAQRNLADPAAALAEARARLEREAEAARRSGDPLVVKAAGDALAHQPRDEAALRAAWAADAALVDRAEPLLRHAEPFPGRDAAEREAGRRNFLALLFCLMLGTAGMPHLLARFYTTRTVRDARVSVAWALLFIVLLYVTAPALAVLVKYAIYHDLVGASFWNLPSWVAAWTKIDPALLSIRDHNGDGVVQLAEIAIGADVIVLATPEIAGLPHVVSALVAAGGLAAALSTADGLLLTIANAFGHDLYHRIVDPGAPPASRVLLSKILLLAAAILAALIAAQRPADILLLVSAAFSFAAAGLFPALVLGIFWKRATGLAAVAGMLAGAGTTLWYMSRTQPWLRQLVWDVPITDPVTGRWWDIDPIAAGVFGVPVGFIVIVLVSRITPMPAAETIALVDSLRAPPIERRADP